MPNVLTLNSRSRYAAVLWLLLGCSAVLGGVAAVGLWPSEPVRVESPDASLEAIARHLDSLGALAQLRSALGDVKADGPVLFFTNSDDWRAIEVFQLTSYLMWPRRVWMVTFAEGSGSPVDNQFAPQGDVGVPSAIVFFKMAPPPELAGRFKSVGRNLHVHVAAEGGR